MTGKPVPDKLIRLIPVCRQCHALHGKKNKTARADEFTVVTAGWKPVIIY